MGHEIYRGRGYRYQRTGVRKFLVFAKAERAERAGRTERTDGTGKAERA